MLPAALRLSRLPPTLDPEEDGPVTGTQWLVALFASALLGLVATAALGWWILS